MIGSAKLLRGVFAALIALCAVYLLATLYQSGKAAGMDQQLHARYWNYAVPAAISEIDHGLGGYRVYVSVLMHFIDGGAQRGSPDLRDELIRSAANIPDVADAGLFFFPGDEKGLQDFVSLAFRLFGHSASSFYLFYFSLLALSIGAHLVCFAGRPSIQALALVALAALTAVVPILPITSELGSPLNPRAFGLLSLMATVSLACFAWQRGSYRWWQILALLAQMVLLAFVVHVRNAEAWQIIGLIFVALCGLLREWRAMLEETSRPWPLLRGPAAAVLGLILFVFLPLQSAVQNRFAPEYASSKLVGKIFWHNVGIGFSVSKYFRAKYGLELNDTNFLLHVANSPEVARAGEAGRRVFWSGTYTGKWVGGDPEIQQAADMYHAGMVRDFVGYEAFARQVVLRFVRDNPLRTAQLLLIDKPRLLLRQTIYAIRAGQYDLGRLMLTDQASALATPAARAESQIGLRLLTVPVLAGLLLAFAGFFKQDGMRRQPLLRPAALLALVSLAPLMVTYPLIHLMASFLAMAAFCLMLLVVICAARLARRAWPRQAR